MGRLMIAKPVATLVAVVTGLLGVLVALAGTGVLSGKAAAWVALVIAVLEGVLGVIAHGNVTPLDNPRDAQGRPLIALTRRN